MTIAGIVQQAQQLLDESQRSTYDSDFHRLVQAIAATADPNEASLCYDALLGLPYTPPAASPVDPGFATWCDDGTLPASVAGLEMVSDLVELYA
jgi:hypothetical protein